LSESGRTQAPAAGIAQGARIAVLALAVVGSEFATSGSKRVASVCSAWVVVVAVLHLSAADSVVAGVIHSTLVTIVAHPGVGDIFAPDNRVTYVRRTGVAVAAVKSLGARLAQSSLARVSLCTHIAVVAGSRNRVVRAAPGRVAAIFRAGVPVVAIEGDTSAAVSARAFVILGAFVVVITRAGVISIVASLRRGAKVVGARVAIVAVQRSRSGFALPVAAEITDGAGIAVVAVP